MVKLQTNSGREFHGDLFLEVAETDKEGQTVTGHDIRTGEEFTVALATPEESAKHFKRKNDTRPFEDRLNDARQRYESRTADITFSDKVTEGSVIRLENVRTFSEGGEKKTAANWATPVSRNPEQEAAIHGKVNITMNSNNRPQISIYFDGDAQPAGEVDFDQHFDAVQAGLNVSQSGLMFSIRDADNQQIISELLTNFRSKGDQSLDDLFDPSNKVYPFRAVATAIVAAQTGRDFNALEFADSVGEETRNNARAIYEALSSGDDSLEITAVPVAVVNFLPTKAEPNFLKDYHGTKNGKESDEVTPDPKLSWKGKGVVPAVVSVSRNPNNEDAAVSARFVMPENKFDFENVRRPRVNLKDMMADATAKVFGETFGVRREVENPAPEQPEQQRKFDNHSLSATP